MLTPPTLTAIPVTHTDGVDDDENGGNYDAYNDLRSESGSQQERKPHVFGQCFVVATRSHSRSIESHMYHTEGNREVAQTKAHEHEI